MKRLTRVFWIALFVGEMILAVFSGLYDYRRGDIKGTFGLIKKLGVLTGTGLFLQGGHYFFKSFWRNLFLLLFALGAFLLGLNIYGKFVSLRNPKVNEGIDSGQIMGTQFSKYINILPTIEVVGDWLAIILIILAGLLIILAFLQGKRIKDAVKKIVKNRLTIRGMRLQRK